MITAVEIEDLALERGGRRLFQGLALNLAAGEAVALTGPNGAGKTSLLRALAGLIRPALGEVRFQGRQGLLEPEEARGRYLHLVGHQDGLKTARSAWEELKFQALWTGGAVASARAAVKAMELERVTELEVRMLSAGQRRRLALGRLLASPRPLWLLDEPLAPLDSGRRARFGEMMAAHLKDGGLILAAVHDPLPIPARTLDLAP